MNEVQKFTELVVKQVAVDKRGEYDVKNVPYFCSHRADHHSYSGYGRVIYSPEGFTLVDIGLNKQEGDSYTTVQTDRSLSALVGRWDVKRLRAKVTLFEGE